MLLTIGIIIGVILIIGVLFVNLSPEFGGSPTKEQKEYYSKSPQYVKGKFENAQGVKMGLSGADTMKALRGYFKSQKNTTPEQKIPIEKIDSLELAEYNGPTQLIWFGHSAFLLQIQGKNILIDPMFGDVPAPHPLLGGKRFSKELPITIEKLPQIDAVIFSHDHYDHLDYGTIQQLKNKVKMFYTPLGVGVHLEEWGIQKKQIAELDWWEKTVLEDLTFTCTPAQHFSGRGLNDRGATLWSSWVISSEGENIFFSGDSGYSPHFKEIGERLGPFDFAMMECGQYNELWSEIHMFPEETVQAAIDVKAKKLMPIHWGAFKLAMHTWTDPVERATAEAQRLGVPLITPVIGEPIDLMPVGNKETYWWQ